MSLDFQKNYAETVKQTLYNYLGEEVTTSSSIAADFKAWFQTLLQEAIQAEFQLVAGDLQAKQAQNAANNVGVGGVPNNPLDTGNSAQQAASAAEQAGRATEAGLGGVR